VIKSDVVISEDQAPGEIDSRFQQILESLPVAIYICDTRGYITEYNNAAARLWGRRPKIGEELWCGSWKIYRTDGSPMDLDSCPMALTLKEGRAILGYEIIIERPDGVRRWIAPHPKPLFNNSGILVGAVNMLEDITESKQFEEETAHLAAIVESSDDAIVGKNLNGIVTSWNNAAERIFGYTAEEMIGQSILRIIPLERHDEEPQILSKLRRGERVDHFETKRVTKDGRLLDISLTISPIKDLSGTVIGVSKIARDITAQKLADRMMRESEERFRMAISATGVGTWEYSPVTGNINWSPECRDIYQLPEHIQPTFALFSRLIHPEDVEYALNAVSQALVPQSGGDYDIQFRILRYSDRKERWVRSQGKVFFNSQNKPEKFIGTVLDITEERQAKAELEQKVEERTKDLRDANLQLAVSNNELEQFAFVASHDLQEPLRKIQAFGDMLKAKVPDESSPEIVDLVNRMQSASVRMKSLIDSLLSFSRVSFRQEQHQLVNLSQVLVDVLADLEASIREKDAIISFSKLYPIKGEPMHLRQLFQNLIGNALKFSRNDQRPVINIASKLVTGAESGLPVPEDVADKTFQLIEVIDNGIGFEQEYAHKIFQLFQRLHGRSEYPGNGMGLSIVQKVVNNHHGYIKAISSPGEGTNFQLLLPFEH
jgi:PAS domain S-box-containing protein